MSTAHNHIHIILSRYVDFNIDKKFPSKRLIEVMGKFIKPHLLANYSYESDIRIKYRMKLNKLLREFKKQNPLFGRKIISLNIRKIYYISRLIYEEKDFSSNQ